MRNSKVLVFLSIIIFSITFIGCNVFSDDSDDDGKDLILSGYYWMAGDEESVDDDASGRASINVYDLTDQDTSPLSFSDLMDEGTYGNKVSNYPEKGMKTYYTVTIEDPDITNPTGYTGTFNVYKIEAKTEFRKKDRIFDHYQEDYYVMDLDGDAADVTIGDSDGEWTSADPIVETDGTDWSVNSMARETMELIYDDDSIRYEWIVSDASDFVPLDDSYRGFYEQFDIDGDMTIPDEADWEPTVETDPVGEEMTWSSEVHYYQNLESWVNYWYVENKEVFGVRYYTESGNDIDGYVKSTLSYERIITQTTKADIDESSFSAKILKWLYGEVDSSDVAVETLSETVIRDEITTANGKKTTKTKTTVVPTFGDSFNIEEYSSYDL